MAYICDDGVSLSYTFGYCNGVVIPRLLIIHKKGRVTPELHQEQTHSYVAVSTFC
jgi:hypothetical protein